MKTLRTLFAIVVFSIGLLTVPNAFAIPQSPQEVVQHTAEEMLAALRTHRSTIANHPEQLVGLVNKIVAPQFDFELISRWALGKHWKKADADQRQRFVKEFRTLIIHTYAKALLEYSDESIRFPQAAITKGKKATVRSEIRAKNGTTIPVQYKMFNKDGAWKAYDVVVDGISLVTNYRASLASEIRKSGMEGLIASLQKRNS